MSVEQSLATVFRQALQQALSRNEPLPAMPHLVYTWTLRCRLRYRQVPLERLQALAQPIYDQTLAKVLAAHEKVKGEFPLLLAEPTRRPGGPAAVPSKAGRPRRSERPHPTSADPEPV